MKFGLAAHIIWIRIGSLRFKVEGWRLKAEGFSWSQTDAQKADRWKLSCPSGKSWKSCQSCLKRKRGLVLTSATNFTIPVQENLTKWIHSIYLDTESSHEAKWPKLEPTPEKALIWFAMYSICSLVSSGNIGKETNSSAHFSAMGKLPLPWPRKLYASWRCIGTG